eukprot:CAMPEP_0174310016 /NCGR_PEP_ID=MMETSP0810-20121108/2783_1 /TAXON_ID=73025 ORGANISM="Eutreptiella gymnastica-like, Strain CCMP1594" /NCGR_SAMPLE_ID=MMETSP0810 /ASSEMBLY_ACC=CAM_ASM_000659 /LENGTH=123 /DNA_ID=CAMNT_0015417817 /DNA_START=840 /DNA_END=1211 /DNA_ORIENTATION=-
MLRDDGCDAEVPCRPSRPASNTGVSAWGRHPAHCPAPRHTVCDPETFRQTPTRRAAASRACATDTSASEMVSQETPENRPANLVATENLATIRGRGLAGHPPAEPMALGRNDGCWVSTDAGLE